MGLTGRTAECAVLDRLVSAVRGGESRALVIHGEIGVGKTALLDYAAEHAPGCRTVRAAGVQSEMELAFAGLHQLCGSLLDHATQLPGPQRDALHTAFGISSGPMPDRFLIGLAVLGLLAEAGADQPLICLVDDQQWLDVASARVLAFVARRLAAEAVGLVFATRVPAAELTGLPQLAVTNLRESEARTVLDASLTTPLDVRLRDRIVAETRGNPLALAEVPRALASPGLAGGFGLPGSVPHAGRIEEGFARRFADLPEPTRRLLVIASAEPAGDPTLVWSAAAKLGIGPDAATPAIEAGLADFDAYVRFRHPLARSVAYRSADVTERRAAHRALAEVIDPQLDPDRRAWHRAHAAPGPDDDVADELERSAGRAQARGGLSAAAAFLERATLLTIDPRRRATRALDAARAKAEAGALDAAVDLLAIAEAGPLDDFQQARLDLVRAQLAFVSSHGSDAPPLLLKAARRLGPIDAELSRATYLDAMSAAMFAGRLAASGGVLEVADAVGPAVHGLAGSRAPDLLLEGLAANYTDGYPAGLPILRKALTAFGAGLPSAGQLHWFWLACIAATHIWDDAGWQQLSDSYVEAAREIGALSELPLALSSRVVMLLLTGELTAAASLTEEIHAVTDATGSNFAPYAALALAAFHGNTAAAAALTESTVDDVTGRGEGLGITLAGWANAVLNNGLGRYDEAMDAAARATAFGADMGAATWAVAEFIEAATRCGMGQDAVDAHRRLAQMTDACGTEWALGIGARCGALLADDDAADALYREAVEWLGRTVLRCELARAHLLYGEWLSHLRRRSEARTQLHTALGMFEIMGMDAFAERARLELLATGESTSTRSPAPGTGGELTAQEAQIARMARDGLSNPEIGARLLISSRTVQYHLRKVFAKLGITSRSQLIRALPDA
ncbi:LuxR family transcriptional regulator [Mycolicibacterium sp. P9-64]|uniref:helix-turn-helix transcriptional regulator n=1 Tax=Mycolicibacterium sp. P9-64 TaxID=2024612 RepID=UPI0011F0230D|nr:LuxR family transcriptional regulator [Mycolicibacterium sp. P9-64]KAA0079076.1 LuxR family transcriptional regulator [Mycolicibacterium sp. P9-64]